MTETTKTARQELLETLRTKVRAPIERHADEILDSFGDDNEGLAAFQLARADLDRLIARVEHEELAELAALLRSHAEELSAGIREMADSLAKARSLTRSAEIFAVVVGIVARVVALA